MSEGIQRKGRPWWLRLAICLGCILAVFVTGELFLRFTQRGSLATHYVDDKVCFYSPSPNSSQRSNEDPDVMENIGADGMRISRPDLKYSKNVKVLVSGCSYTFGVGVPDKDTYVWRLNEICPEADFDNLGVGGYGPYRSYLRQERYMPLHKYDLLIYSMLANHLDRDSISHQSFSDLERKSDLVALPYIEMRGPDNFVEHPLEMYEWPGDDRLYLINFLRNFTLSLNVRMRRIPSEEEKQAIFAYLINKMAAQAREQGAKFALVVLDRNPVPEAMFSLDVHIIDIAFKCKEEDEDKYRVRNKHNNHPNGIVHNFWARELALKLRENHLLEVGE